jgi:NAD(P)-dependent dehydrogenase (short-subunit alcohol dehydrogenase family)|tara:strand:+ start:135 stop:866 length:732 start_codon:yes stop_codon:yes gene_type:complete
MAKKIIISGASSGIGRQAAIDLSSKGYEIIALGRNEEKLIELLDNLNGNNNTYKLLDLENEEAVKSVFLELKSDGIKVSGIVACAGSHIVKPIKVSKNIDYQSMMSNNFYSFTNIVSNIGKLLEKDASIIVISSAGVIRSAKAVSGYAASKMALEGFVRSAALEFSKNGVRVNVISPGVVLTEMTKEFMASIGEEATSQMLDSHPLGVGSPQDVSNLINFLISTNSKWITGQNIVIDGGFSIN